MAEKRETGVKALFKDGQLLISVPTDNPTVSSSGRSLTIGGTRGPIEIEDKYQGAPVWLNVNVYVRRKDLDAVSATAAGQLPQEALDKMKEFTEYMEQHADKAGLGIYLNGISEILNKQ